MGKIFDVLEKFEKERLMRASELKLRKADLIALLKYDHSIGKLDLFNSEIIKNPETPQRLLDNNLVFPDGRLSPKGFLLCKKYQKNKKF
ncbi:MAG: hypothetical protein PVI00_12985 [Desulfobacterales bacterium]|jgi:hypothetical protein